MMHAKSESDITSLGTSSPRSSMISPKPPHAVYYVQSPSRDSHEEDKSSTSASATATQATTPVGLQSPSDALSLLSLFGRQSRSSSASHVSGAHGFRRKGRSGSGRRERGRLIESRGLEEVEEEKEVYLNWWRDEEREELSSSCKGFLGLIALGLVFMVCCFVVWGVSRPFIAQLHLKKMVVNNFYFGEGSDRTGVPTKMLTINCSLTMKVHNPSTFFGIHVRCSTFNLRYYDLTIASGQMDTYYQPKKSWRNVSVSINGMGVPLYGAGTGFLLSRHGNRIPLVLEFEIRSQGNVVGKLVKASHQQRIQCPLRISSSSTQIVKFTDDSCIKV